LKLAIAQVREISITPILTPLFRWRKVHASDRALELAIGTMSNVEGASTRRITKVIMEELCGLEVSSGQVSNLNKQFEAEFEKWCNPPLLPIAYLLFDASNQKVHIDRVVHDCPKLIALRNPAQ
jgi:transposase-like protein